MLRALTAQSAVEEPDLNDLVLSGSKVSFDAKKDPTKAVVYFKHDTAQPLSVDVSIPFDDLGVELSEEERPEQLPDEELWPPKTIEFSWERRYEGETRLWANQLRIGTTPLITAWESLESTTIDGPHLARKWQKALGFDRAIPGNFEQRVLPNSSFSGIDQLLRGETERLMARAARNRVAHASDSRDDESWAQVFTPALSRIVQIISTASFNYLRRMFDKSVLLTSVRGTQLMSDEAGIDVEFVGKHGENTVLLLNSNQAQQRDEYDLLEEWAERFGLPRIRAGLDGRRLKVSFRDEYTNTTLDLDQAASGTKQGLIMAAQLLLSPPDSTILLEEPEINLHPKFEKQLPELFGDSIRSGDKQIIATTHSEILIAALASALRKGRHAKEAGSEANLTIDDVIVWHLERDEEGVIRALEVKISDREYLETWVTSFNEVEKELYHEWYQEIPTEGDEGGH